MKKVEKVTGKEIVKVRGRLIKSLSGNKRVEDAIAGFQKVVYEEIKKVAEREIKTNNTSPILLAMINADLKSYLNNTLISSIFATFLAHLEGPSETKEDIESRKEMCDYYAKFHKHSIDDVVKMYIDGGFKIQLREEKNVLIKKVDYSEEIENDVWESETMKEAMAEINNLKKR